MPLYSDVIGFSFARSLSFLAICLKYGIGQRHVEIIAGLIM